MLFTWGEHCIPDALLQAEWKKEAVARRVERINGLSCRLQSSPSSSACVGSVVSRGVEGGRLAAKEHLVKLAATGTKVGRVAVNAFLVGSGVGVELGEVAWGNSERVSRVCEWVEQRSVGGWAWMLRNTVQTQLHTARQTVLWCPPGTHAPPVAAD